MAVLKIESVEELLRFLAADLAQRLLHGQRRPRVLCHGVGKDLGIGPVDGADFGLVVAAFKRHRRLCLCWRSLGHGSHAGMLNPGGAENRARICKVTRLGSQSLCACNERTRTMGGLLA